MIVGTSALIAILRKGLGYQSFIETLLKAERVRLSAATLLESRMVAKRDNGLAELAELLVTLDAEITAVDQAQSDVACDPSLARHRVVGPSLLVGRCVLLELCATKSGLTDYRQQRSCPNVFMIGNRNRDGGFSKLFSHYDVASTLAHSFESVRFEDSEDSPFPRKPSAQPTATSN